MFSFLKGFLHDLLGGMYIVFIALFSFLIGFFYANQITLFGFNPCEVKSSDLKIKDVFMKPSINTTSVGQASTKENKEQSINITQNNQIAMPIESIARPVEHQVNIVVDPNTGESSVSISKEDNRSAASEIINSREQNTTTAKSYTSETAAVTASGFIDSSSQQKSSSQEAAATLPSDKDKAIKSPTVEVRKAEIVNLQEPEDRVVSFRDQIKKSKPSLMLPAAK